MSVRGRKRRNIKNDERNFPSYAKKTAHCGVCETGSFAGKEVKKMLNEMKVNDAELNEQELNEAAGGDWLDDVKEWGNGFLDKAKEGWSKAKKTIIRIIVPDVIKPLNVPEIPVLPPDQPIL